MTPTPTPPTEWLKKCTRSWLTQPALKLGDTPYMYLRDLDNGDLEYVGPNGEREIVGKGIRQAVEEKKQKTEQSKTPIKAGGQISFYASALIHRWYKEVPVDDRNRRLSDAIEAYIQGESEDEARITVLEKDMQRLKCEVEKLRGG